MPEPKRMSPTRMDDVYSRLRRDILGGEMLPGQQLKFADLSTRYGSSIGVIREALVKLAARGLVRSETNRGFTVTPLSDAGLRELTEARSELEVLVLAHAIRDGDLAWESRLVAAHHVMEQTPAEDASNPGWPSEEWIVAHADFHEALLDGCANRRLLAMAESLREETELYRRWLVPTPHPEQLPDVTPAGTHEQLLEASLARDVARASAVLRSLIDHTGSMGLDPSIQSPSRSARATTI